jgi:hypothetical protein
MQIIKKLIQGCFCLAVALNAGVAQAFSLISERQIIPSTNLPTLKLSSGFFPINQIADGITRDGLFPTFPGPFNGFASPAATGTITLDLVGEFNLSSFILWNDINVFQEGIKDFRLNFFTSSNSLIPVNFSTNFTAPITQVEAEEYVFGEVVPGVSGVELVVLSSQQSSSGINRIEIREVAFTGDPVASVPEPLTVFGSILGLGILGAVKQKRKQQ